MAQCKSALVFCRSPCTVIWTPDEGPDAVVSILHASSVRTVQWNQNNKVVASGGDGGRILLHYATGEEMGHLPTGSSAALMAPVTCLAFSKGSKRLAAGSSDGKTYVWDLKQQVRRLLRMLDSRVCCAGQCYYHVTLYRVQQSEYRLSPLTCIVGRFARTC